MDVGLVCDTCSTFNPMGAKLCTRCGDPLSLEEPRHTAFDDDGVTRVGIGSAMPSYAVCPSCGARVLSSHKFCGQCGYRMVESSSAAPAPATLPAAKKSPALARGVRSTQLFGAMQASRAKLVVIRGDGMDGMSFTLAGDEHLVGRSDAAILFEDDPFISPVHANFYYDMGTLVVRDESSANGVYIRIHDPVDMHVGDRFLVGEQLLEVQETPLVTVAEAVDDGTYFFASPPKQAYFRVVQRLLGGASGMVHHAYTPDIVIGREDNDINFPGDPFISGKHALLSLRAGKLTLTDLSSKNGTFLRINGAHALKHGDYVFMGQQLLRVEIV